MEWIISFKGGDSYQQTGLMINTSNKLRFGVDTLIFPWIAIGAKGKNVMNVEAGNFFTNQYLFNTYDVYSNFYKCINFIPYFAMTFYILSGSISSHLKHKNF